MCAAELRDQPVSWHLGTPAMDQCVGEEVSCKGSDFALEQIAGPLASFGWTLYSDGQKNSSELVQRYYYIRMTGGAGGEIST